MPRRLSCLIVLLLTAAGLACGNNPPTPSAPTPPPVPPAPVPSGPTLTRVFVGSGNQGLTAGTSLQLHAFAVYSNAPIVEVTDKSSWRTSNPVVATISNTGLLTALQAGIADAFVEYQDKEAVAEISVISPPPPLGRGEVVGQLHEAAPMDDVWMSQGRVTISGGDYDGRSVEIRVGTFHFSDIFNAGFDLVASSPGYRTTRHRIAVLPRDAVADMSLEVDPSLVSEVFEESCNGVPHSVVFTPRQGDGIFRVTQAYHIGYAEDFYVELLANGVVLTPFPRETITMLHAGTTYELRVRCDFNVPFHVNYLRPR